MQCHMLSDTGDCESESGRYNTTFSDITQYVWNTKKGREAENRKPKHIKN